ncbi:TIGR02679 family protein [Thermomonospora echinospora]|uniref:TIGR02679 family protein n=1 Tax=Thermomonospora echinospora TaxID=1992 RepID=A0A1H6AXV3_9ACTN|nr:DUF2399 domain-containing protein [Thermomonospora echinospora]SEG52887.1 TIGR02679 family protein [Thermomonospora echinospora]
MRHETPESTEDEPAPPTELPASLASWARLPGPAKVIEAIRERAARGHSTDKGTLRLNLDADERRQVARLVGNSWNVSGRPVRLQDLSAALDGVSPLQLAELACGPVTVRAKARAERAARHTARAASVRAALESAGVAAHHAETWQSENPRAVELGEKVARVWHALSGEPIHLTRLATEVCGNAHALDGDQALGRAVARLAAVVHDLERPQRAGPTWRTAWRAVGVLCNEVSSRVLVLNLPLAGSAPAVALTAAAPGEPVWLTLRSLTGRWRPTSPQPVYVCENPTIVEAAADRHGARCAPLVCTDGVAAAAAMTLIGALASAGCTVHARADFDRVGLGIVDRLRTVAPSLQPWRFDLTSYRAAGGTTAIGDLAAAAAAHPVHEEALLPVLLDDLARR